MVGIQIGRDMRRRCWRHLIGLNGFAVARFFCCLKQDVQDEQDEGGLGAAQQLWRQRSDLFRSVRTYMSIEKCVSQFFKVREDLNRTETARRNIKVLADLRVLLGLSCYRHEGPNGP